MYRKLQENRSYTKTLVLFGALFAVFMFGCVLISDILLPVSAAMLSVFMLFDKSRGKWLSIAILSLLLVCVCLINFSNAIFLLTALLCAIILNIGYCKGLNKAELSVYCTILYALCTVAGLYFIAARELGTFNFGAVIEYYNTLFEDLVQRLLAQMKESLLLLVQSGQELGFEEDEFLSMFEDMIRSFSKTFLSLLVIVAFFYAGIQIKLFTALTLRYESEPRSRQSWHFALSNVFAYFYIALAILSPFLSNMDSVVVVAILNLYYIFMFVFAYVGFNYALHFVSQMRKKALARFIFIIFLVMANAVAVQILSFIGVFITTMHNKFLKMNGGGQDTPEE